MGFSNRLEAGEEEEVWEVRARASRAEPPPTETGRLCDEGPCYTRETLELSGVILCSLQTQDPTNSASHNREPRTQMHGLPCGQDAVR